MGLPEEVRRIIWEYCRSDDLEFDVCPYYLEFDICSIDLYRMHTGPCQLITVTFSSSSLLRINRMINEECKDLVVQRLTLIGRSLICLYRAVL